MRNRQHRRRHEALRDSLVEIAVDWVLHTRRSPAEATVIELIAWARRQVERPNELPPQYNPHGS